MAKTRAHELSTKSKGAAYLSGGGYKGVLRRGSKYGWKYEDGKTSQSKGGFDTAEEAAYHYDEFLIAYLGPDADTNQALGFLKQKHVLEIREKISKSERPKASQHNRRLGKYGLKGVHKIGGKQFPWMAQLAYKGKILTIGKYKTILEAARAYDLAALRYKGTEATTNLSLGLVPPIGKDHLFVAPEVKEAAPRKRAPKYAPTDHDDDDDEKQPETNTGERFILASDAEREREAQIIAARAMQDNENSVGDGELSEEVPDAQPVIIPSEPEAPTAIDPVEPAPAITQTTELIVMSEADKLRAKAEAMLREAAEIDAGNIKREAQQRLDALTSKLSGLQSAMLTIIDCCAEIETEIQNLKALLK